MNVPLKLMATSIIVAIVAAMAPALLVWPNSPSARIIEAISRLVFFLAFPTAMACLIISIWML